MNSVDANSKRTEGGYLRIATRIAIRWVLVPIASLIVIFVPGIALDATFGVNHILLYVNADGKVSLSPQPGDIISFATANDKTGKTISVTYAAGLMPCKNYSPTDPTCEYQPVGASPALYLFGCKSTSGVTCFDPQFGPKCVGCGGRGGGVNFPHWFPRILHAVIWDFEESLGLAPDAQRVQQERRELEGGSSDVTSTPPERVQEYVVACDKTGKGAIYDSSGGDPIDDAIIVEPYDTVTWTLYPPATKYDISGIQHICGSPSSDDPSCTINGGVTGSYPIHLKTEGCSDHAVTDWSLEVKTPQ